jgi:hypothetical protein
MAAEGDGAHNGVDVRRHSLFPPLSALTQRKLRWARFKSILFLANLVLSLYALALLVFVILTYLRTLPPPPSSSSRTKQNLARPRWRRACWC